MIFTETERKRERERERERKRERERERVITNRGTYTGTHVDKKNEYRIVR